MQNLLSPVRISTLVVMPGMMGRGGLLPDGLLHEAYLHLVLAFGALPELSGVSLDVVVLRYGPEKPSSMAKERCVFLHPLVPGAAGRQARERPIHSAEAAPSRRIYLMVWLAASIAPDDESHSTVTAR
ncbi:MAG TPA: hypothetical protein VEC01_16145 [Noviherbaspirillum sp.]|uniref:hypothetical protein n=1 Tax=Noviherbaspirillum sp. TaxID=1926288 RepID=UPI002D6BAFDA|nr:hypothetical protein [Noviherbaspirillum sp.]HYD96862.1 hypothetical protein [Noviherbaspirillum sp.]